MMIFFDVDGTLVDHKSAEREAALAFQKEYREVFPETPDGFVNRWQTVAEKHVRRYLARELSFQGQRRARLQELFSHHTALSDSEADEMFHKYLRQYEESWRLYPDVMPCLNTFSRQKLGIISNGDSKQQRQKLETLGIAQYFSTVVVSGDIGIAKPDPLIFHAACKAAGCSPNECLFIGNDLDIDAKGSISAGLRGIWLNRDGHKQQEGIPAISSLEELKEIIELHNHRG